ncbi:MAG: LA2681 family HEPN domain-containing protein [Bellilinea sp.]
MIENEDFVKYEHCNQLINQGKYDEALIIAESILNPAYRASVLVDAGFALGKSSKVSLGTDLFKDLITSEEGKGFPRQSLLFNAANGHYSLYTLRWRTRNKTIPSNDKDLRLAKRFYREALKELPFDNGEFTSQVWVNYGNCLSKLGRFAEAIECYQESLKADPTNGMAAGNLGIELEYVSRLTGKHAHEYLALAHEMLTRALGDSTHLKFGSPNAVHSFQEHLANLTHVLRAHKEPISVPEPIRTSGKTKAINEYVQFCIYNGLFLNAWVGDPLLSPGLSDELSYGPIVTSLNDNCRIPELLRILNEIKEAFATARYLFFLSQRKNSLLNYISGMTIYFNNLDYDVNGIYTGLCKTAYTRAFDILDKVARIINVYFGIGNRKNDFWRMFVEKQSHGEEHTEWFAVRPTIARSGIYSLYALADICVDYFEQKHVDLTTIDKRRNKITHDYLTVRLFHLKNESDEVVDLDDLAKQTRDVLLLAKHAVVYAVSAVNLAEAQKKTIEKTGHLIYGSNPGQPFM